MRKKYYRFFGGLFSVQEKWLNQMAAQGYRLIRTKKLLYEFETCPPNAYQYRVEFVGQKSKENRIDYCNFLEDLGYQVLSKNINLNYSIGKIRYRPWTEKGAHIVTNSTTMHRELLIIEKVNDSKLFDHHSTYRDKITYYKSLRNPWFCLFLMSMILGVISCSVVFLSASILMLPPVILYQMEIIKMNEEANTYES